MPLLFETDAERRALTDAWGDSALVGSARINGQFDAEQAEDLLVEGIAPTFRALKSDLERYSISIGTTIDSVFTFSGETYGPFRIARWQQEDNGDFVLLVLNQT